MYFDFCRNKAFRPGIESLATALCVHRNTMYQWSKGRNCDAERKDLINNALQLIHSFLEQCGLSGRLSPPSYIFLCKAWLGYKESYSIENIAPTRNDEKFDARRTAAELGIKDIMETELLQTGDDYYDDIR